MATGKSSYDVDVSSATETDVPTLVNLLSGSSITSTKLNGASNFLPWSAAIKTFLLSKDKLKYITKDPKGGKDAKWLKEDAQVRSWLWNSMEPHISANVVLLATAYLVYSFVCEPNASNNNINRIYKLCEEIFRMNKGSKSLKDYYSYGKGRREELTLYQPCPQDLATRQTEQLKVVSFLSGLDAQYGSAKNQLLSGNQLPPLNVAFSRLSRIPVQMENTPEEDSLAAVKPSSMTTRGRGRGVVVDRYCDFCNVAGHTKDKC